MRSTSLGHTLHLALAMLALCELNLGNVNGADPFAPQEIELAYFHVAPELITLTQAAPIERGQPRPVLDTLGWIVGIPGKILLWDRRIDNHHVSAETEAVMRRYLEENGLQHVKVRINQYAPLEEWKRLRQNRTVGWGYRYTLGTLSVLGDAVFPGRVFGGDRYNPFTATIQLYSDVPAIALHEGGHAKDFTRRRHPGTYAVVTALPFANLWPEAIATGDAIAFARNRGETELERETYRVLYPAYGTYVGSSFAEVVSAPAAMPVYAGAIVAGHVVGRLRASQVKEYLPVEPQAELAMETTFGDDANFTSGADSLEPPFVSLQLSIQPDPIDVWPASTFWR